MELSAEAVRGWQRQLADTALPAGSTEDTAPERPETAGAVEELAPSATVLVGTAEPIAAGLPDPEAAGRPCDPVSVALEAAERLRDIDWASVPVADLPAVTALVARAVRHGEAALLAAAGRLEATGAAGELGWANAKDFLTHVIGGHQGTGGGLVRLAAQVADLPDLAAALEAGPVSLPQARAIARQVTTLPRDEQLRAEATTAMLGLVAAEHLNATDLDRRFDDVVKTIDPDGTRIGEDRAKEKQERGAHGARFLGGTPDGRGGVKIKGFSTVEEWELLKTTLAPLAAPKTTEPGACGGDPDLFRKRDQQRSPARPRVPRTGVRPRRPRPPRPRRPHLGRPRRALRTRLRRDVPARRATAPRPGSSSPSTPRTSPMTCPTTRTPTTRPTWPVTSPTSRQHPGPRQHPTCPPSPRPSSRPRPRLGTRRRVHQRRARIRARARVRGRGGVVTVSCSPVTGSPSRPCDGWGATPRSSGWSSAPTVRSSTSAAHTAS